MKNIPNPLHNKDGKLLRQASIQAEATEMQVDEGQHHEQWETESKRQHGEGCNIGHQEEDSACVGKLQQVQQDLARKKHWREDKGNASQEASAFSASLCLWNVENDKGRGKEAWHLPDQVPQKNLPHQMAVAFVNQGSAGDGRSSSSKWRGEKEEMLLDWICVEERQFCCS